MTATARWGLGAAALIAFPVLVGIGYSGLAAFGMAGPGAAGAGWTRVVEVLGARAVWRGVGWSLWVGLTATLLATSAAVVVAAVYRGSRALDRLGRGLALVPLPVPHLVAALLGLQVLGQSGYLARVGYHAGWVPEPAAMPALTQDPAGIGLILVLAWKEFPFLALMAIAVLASRGAGLEEAARTLGAGRADAFRRVTWPILWRGLLPAVVAVFIFVVGTYEATALLAPADPLALPLLTFERTVDPDLARRGEAYVLILVGVGISLLAVVAHEWARGLVDRLGP